MNPTFHEWLMQHIDRDTPTGDIARDAKFDDNAKGVTNSLRAWKMHLRKFNACDAALRALESAWKAYKQKYPDHEPKTA